MNKSKFLVSVALVLIASMILASCAPAATAVAPEPPAVVEPTEEVVVQPTEEVMEPTAAPEETPVTLAIERFMMRPGRRYRNRRVRLCAPPAQIA